VGAEPPADVDMPPVESLDENSDYSGFFSPRVSEQLRQSALRKLFHTSKFNVIDGLDDYAEDYRNFAPLGNIVTAHMRHRMEVEAERMKEKLAGEQVQSQNEGQAEPGPSEADALADGEPAERSDGRDEDEPHEQTDEPLA
jgi:hypothetical protein